MDQLDKHPHTYREWMMQSVPGPRLIIESGSNSRNGINSEMLAEAFDITPIMIATASTHALIPRGRRIIAHAKPGDVVLLPLEWIFYTLEKDFFLSLIDLTYRFYAVAVDQARYLSPRERWEFLHIPKNQLWGVFTFSDANKPSWPQRSAIFEAFWEAKELPAIQPETSALHASLNNGSTANRYGDSVSSPTLLPGTVTVPTIHFPDIPPVLGQPFLTFLSELSTFAKNNPDITILFTPPATSLSQELLDSPEYKASQEAFIAVLLPVLTNHGFTMIGNIDDSSFNWDAYGDSAYHIQHSYRNLRTERLIEHLKPYLKERDNTL